MTGLRTLGRRLEALRREGRPRSVPPETKGAEPIVFRRGLPRSGAPPPRGSSPPGPAWEADRLPPGEVVTTAAGRAYVIDTEEEIPAGAEGEGVVWFDIEATGLTSMPLFLIGAMREVKGRLRVRQLLARDYSEEAAVILLFGEELEGARGLVSFNGKSYDLPYIRNRAAATGVAFAAGQPEGALPHRDLLHECRRAYGERLSDCRLGTLEREILHQPRTDDLPGREVPEAYHAWVRTGDARTVVEILRHNHRDLVSMAALVARLEG